MPVDGLDAPVRAGDEEFRVYELFYGEDDAVLDLEADCGPRVLDGLVCVLDLEYSAVGGVGTGRKIIACSNGILSQI